MPAYIINRSHCISAHLKQYTVINRKYMPRSAQYDTENINYDTYHVDGSQLTHTRTQHYEKQCGMHHAHYHDSKEDTVVNKKVYYIIYALLYIQNLPPVLFIIPGSAQFRKFLPFLHVCIGLFLDPPYLILELSKLFIIRRIFGSHKFFFKK